MFLGSALIIGGLWWGWEVRRRPGHRRRDYRGPALMIAAGAGWLGLFLFSASFW